MNRARRAATSMLLGFAAYKQTIKILSAEWTDDMPKVVTPPPHK